MKTTFQKLIKFIMPALVIISFIIFPPWDIVWTWLSLLPDSIQEQVDNALDRGFDRIIVYVVQGGKESAFLPNK